MIPGGGSKGGGRSPLLLAFQGGVVLRGGGKFEIPPPLSVPLALSRQGESAERSPPEGETSRGVWL